MYYFFPGTHIEELEAKKLMGGSLGVEHTHDMLVLFVNLIVGLENHPPVQRCSSLPVLYMYRSSKYLHTSNENPLLIVIIKPTGVLISIIELIKVLLLILGVDGVGGKAGHGSNH